MQSLTEGPKGVYKKKKNLSYSHFVLAWEKFYVAIICQGQLHIKTISCLSASMLLSALIVHQLLFPCAEWTGSLIDLLQLHNITNAVIKSQAQSTAVAGGGPVSKHILLMQKYINYIFTLHNFNFQNPASLIQVTDNSGLLSDYILTRNKGNFQDWTKGGTINQHGEFLSLCNCSMSTLWQHPFAVCY